MYIRSSDASNRQTADSDATEPSKLRTLNCHFRPPTPMGPKHLQVATMTVMHTNTSTAAPKMRIVQYVVTAPFRLTSLFPVTYKSGQPDPNEYDCAPQFRSTGPVSSLHSTRTMLNKSKIATIKRVTEYRSIICCILAVLAIGERCLEVYF